MCTQTLLALPALLLLLAPARPSTATATVPNAPSATQPQGPGLCARSAFKARKARRREAQSDLLNAIAVCFNVTDEDEREECVSDAFEEYFEGLDEADEQYDARLDLCVLLGGGAYDPELDPDDFDTLIDNPYLPYLDGTTWTYEKTFDGETETIVVAVTDEVREIMGVECLGVRDTVEVDGEIVEDTIDYFAQDEDGNVWYFGETSKEFEDGYLVSLEGSWFAGVDGAKPGIVMPAARMVGDTYRQEWLLAEAEDAATIVSVNAGATVPAGDYTNCVQTRDFTPLEPGVSEFKFYAAGVGLVLETDPDSGERLELISVTAD